jgi:hypothetical protein
MSEPETQRSGTGEQRDSFASRNAATIMGLSAVLLMVLATLYTMWK